MRFQFPLILIAFMLCAIATQSTLKYEGVSWNEKRNLWQAEFHINGKKRKSYFGNEFDAAKHFNRLCVKMGIHSENPAICAIPNQQTKEKTSQYKGVSYDKYSGKWNVLVYVKGQKQKYGGQFNDELDAAKRVNQLCEEFGTPLLHPEISTIPNQQHQFKEKTSQYKGVSYDIHRSKWKTQVSLKGQMQRYGGTFDDELDAAKRVNQLCEELRIPLLNPDISAKPNQQYQFKVKTSKYKGVSYEKRTCKWNVRVYVEGQKHKYGGTFNDELDAAKRVNQLCEDLGIPLLNPEISAIPNQQYQFKEKTSQYKGVSYDKQTGKWKVKVCLKGQEKYGGQFNDELDAAKRVNQLCKELGIPQKNPTISAMPNQQRTHDGCQTANLFNSEILETDNDDAKKKKRKRRKQINDDDELSAENYYFYDHLLK